MMRLAPNVTFEMLDAAFWLERAPDPDAPLLAPEQIAAFNTHVHEVIGIPPVLDLPDTLPRDEVLAHIRAYVPTRPLYTVNGDLFDTAVAERLLDPFTADLPELVPVYFGMAVQPAHLRAFPTVAVATSEPFQYAFDRFEETTIDAGWPVAVLTGDLDCPWQFCLTPHYWGWVQRAHITLTNRDAVHVYTAADPFITATAPHAGLVNLETGQPLLAQMGTRLPLTGEMAAAYRTLIPVAAEADCPSVGRANAQKGDFAVGHLPLTLRSLFTQAFKLLGEPYAWGGSRMGIFGRDCSRMIRDVYATTGVYLPRNGDQQGRACREIVAFTPEMDDPTRKAALIESVPPGAVLELPGHVVLYLGHVNGEPYVIHDTASSGFSEVIVSDLSLGAGSPAGSLLRRLSRAVVVGL